MHVIHTLFTIIVFAYYVMLSEYDICLHEHLYIQKVYNWHAIDGIPLRTDEAFKTRFQVVVSKSDKHINITTRLEIFRVISIRLFCWKTSNIPTYKPLSQQTNNGKCVSLRSPKYPTCHFAGEIFVLIYREVIVNFIAFSIFIKVHTGRAIVLWVGLCAIRDIDCGCRANTIQSTLWWIYSSIQLRNNNLIPSLLPKTISFTGIDRTSVNLTGNMSPEIKQLLYWIYLQVSSCPIRILGGI